MIDATVTGLDGLRADFARLPRVTKTHVAAADAQTAAAIVNGARARVHVRSGRLRAAIAARVIRDEAAEVRTRIEITDPVAAAYAVPVEFGTRFAGANPFMGPAADAERSKHEGRLNAAGREIEMEMQA